VAWEDKTTGSTEINMKDLKTNRVTRITNNDAARNLYFNSGKRPDQAIYDNKLVYCKIDDETNYKPQFWLTDQKTWASKFLANVEYSPIEMDMYGNYIVYNVNRYENNKYLGTDIRMMDIRAKKEIIIYRAGSGRYNPTIFGTNLFWIDHGYIKRYNLKNRKISNEAYNGRSLNTQLPNSDTVYGGYGYYGYGRYFSVYGNYLVFNSYLNGQWDIRLKTLSSVNSGFPLISFTYTPLSPHNNQLISFNGTFSRDADGKIISYQWYFSDGTTATGSLVYHRFTTSGSKKVTLKIKDNDGIVKYLTKTILVS
jgi:hypothetical protein